MLGVVATPLKNFLMSLETFPVVAGVGSASRWSGSTGGPPCPHICSVWLSDSKIQGTCISLH